LHRHWIELGHLSSHLLAISRHTARSYQRLIAEPNDLPAPISQAYLPNFLKEHASTIGEVPVADLDGRPFVVYCSTIEIRKNHQLLLNVWDRLQHEISADRLPLLVFVGRWGWHTEIVRLLIERNWRLRRHVRVLDRVSDAELIWLYRNARFTVFPSYAEGFGLAAAESLSFGTPVVVSDCPALVEATEGLMPAHDPQDFAAWCADIRSLATDDARLGELRAAVEQYRGPAYDEFAKALRDVAFKALAA
jgi:glycosyltransferase involved in cell wall biosynthesis